jgi:hypothetical protein
MVVTVFCETAIGDAGDESEPNIRTALDCLTQALAYIFAKQLPWQEGMSESLVQVGVILSLVQLTKHPVQEVTGLVCSN